MDPALTDNLPKSVTISTGLDAINQAMESIWNKNLNQISERFATASIKNSLYLISKRSFTETDRDNLSAASLLSGMAINLTRTALCHSISYPITAHFGVPHGLACAFTMPAVLKLNLAFDDGRFQRLSNELCIKDLYKEFCKLHKALDVVGSVKKYISNFNDLQAHVSEMYTPERAENNLAYTNNEIITNILRESWDN